MQQDIFCCLFLQKSRNQERYFDKFIIYLLMFAPQFYTNAFKKRLEVYLFISSTQVAKFSARSGNIVYVPIIYLIVVLFLNFERKKSKNLKFLCSRIHTTDADSNN